MVVSSVHFSCVQLFATIWTVGHQALLSMKFSKQEYWNGLLCPLPGDLPSPGIEPVSFMSPALAGRFITTSTTWESPYLLLNVICIVRGLCLDSLIIVGLNFILSCLSLLYSCLLSALHFSVQFSLSVMSDSL